MPGLATSVTLDVGLAYSATASVIPGILKEADLEATAIYADNGMAVLFAVGVVAVAVIAVSLVAALRIMRS